MPTRFMEVLEIQGIVTDLVYCIGLESRFADLELKDEQHVIEQHHGIDALAEPRDGELEKDASSTNIGG